MVDWGKYPSLIEKPDPDESFHDAPDVPLDPQEVQQFEKRYGPLAGSVGELVSLMLWMRPAEKEFSSKDKAIVAIRIFASAKKLQKVIETTLDWWLGSFFEELHAIFFKPEPNGIHVETDHWKERRRECKSLGNQLMKGRYAPLNDSTVLSLHPDLFPYFEKEYGPLLEDLSDLPGLLREVDRLTKIVNNGRSEVLCIDYELRVKAERVLLLGGKARLSALTLSKALEKALGSDVEEYAFFSQMTGCLCVCESIVSGDASKEWSDYIGELTRLADQLDWCRTVLLARREVEYTRGEGRAHKHSLEVFPDQQMAILDGVEYKDLKQKAALFLNELNEARGTRIHSYEFETIEPNKTHTSREINKLKNSLPEPLRKLVKGNRDGYRLDFE